MPRPSLKDQRSREILDAFVTCAASYGLEGATLERIATEAGVQRSILRHYLGNRDQMISALTNYVIGEFDALVAAMREALADSNDIADLIDLLFDPRSQTDPRLVLVYQALVASAGTYPEMRDPLLETMKRFIGLVMDQVRASFPTQRRQDCLVVAHGIVGIYLTCDALAPLDPPNHWSRSAKRAATALANTLRDLTK